MILIKNCGRDGAKDFLDNLLERFTRPWTVAGEEHYLEMNAGIAFYPQGDDSCGEIYRRSTLALYRAAEEEPNMYAFYLEGSEEKAGSVYNAEQRLRHAVINGMEGFGVKYLPVIDTEGHIIALEAYRHMDYKPLLRHAQRNNRFQRAKRIGGEHQPYFPRDSAFGDTQNHYHRNRKIRTQRPQFGCGNTGKVSA